MDYSLTFSINNKNRFNYNVKSRNFRRGKNECLFKNPLFTNERMLKEGYLVHRFPKNWAVRINDSITEYVKERLRDNGVEPYNFTLDKYHNYVDDYTHRGVVDSFRGGFFGTGGIHLNKLGIPYKELDEWVNGTIGSKGLSCHYKRYGISIKHFWIRIVRPNVNDNNPPHKDIHVGRNRDSINIYLPLAGSNENSSLPVIPRSHLENESEYIISASPCYVNNRKFVVPAVVHREQGLNMVTPNPGLNQIMFFTPHLIHGGGVNINKNLTRVSLEMRFFK